MARKNSQAAQAAIGAALMGASYMKKNGAFGSSSDASSDPAGIPMADVSNDSPSPESSAPLPSDSSSASADADWKRAFANGGMVGCHGDRHYGKKKR